MNNNYTDIITNIKLKLHILTSISYITISHILSVYIIILYILSNILHILFSQIYYSYTDTFTLSVNSEHIQSTTNPEVKHIERQVDGISTLKVFWRATKYLDFK